jgi:anti-sigma factor RsiW
MTTPTPIVSAVSHCRFDNVDDLAEQYCLGQLSADQAFAFEVHCCSCRRCTAALEDAALFVEAFRAASAPLLESLRTHQSLNWSKTYVD